jgi:RNA polymerase sigma-70 factor (ECF subfamily)
LQHLEHAARLVAAGDVTAFQTIVEATSSRFVRLAARMLGSQVDAEDVVQEAYVKAYRSLAAGDFDERARVETWLYRIVANSALDAQRRKKRHPLSDDADFEGQWDGARAVESQLALRELADMLDALPPEQRAALVLKVVEGLSSREVADTLGISEGAVEQRLVRARASLRERAKA